MLFSAIQAVVERTKQYNSNFDIICSSKLTVFLELCFRTIVSSLFEQRLSADKYPRIFSRQMKAIVHIFAILKSKETREMHFMVAADFLFA